MTKLNVPCTIVMSDLIGFWLLPDDIRGVVLGFYDQLAYNERIRELIVFMHTPTCMQEMAIILAPDKIAACANTLAQTGCTDALALFISAVCWTMWDAEVHWCTGAYYSIYCAGVTTGTMWTRSVCSNIDHDWSAIPANSEDVIGTLRAMHAVWKRIGGVPPP